MLSQYSHRFRIGMVVYKGDSDKSDSYAVQCPICLQPVIVNISPKVSLDGDTLITISNYTRHIKLHLSNVKENKRKSKAKKQASADGGKIVKHKASKLCEEELIVTSSDSDDNEKDEIEMKKNFERDDSDNDMDLSLDEDESFSTQDKENPANVSPLIERPTKMKKVDSSTNENNDIGKLLRKLIFLFELSVFVLIDRTH